MNWGGTAAACPWCGAPYVYPRHWLSVLPPAPQPTCRCLVWSWTVTTTTTTTKPRPTDDAPVREQTDREAIETLEEKVDRLTLELARLRRDQGTGRDDRGAHEGEGA